MNAIREPSQEEIDAGLEREIETAHLAYADTIRTGTPDDIKAAFAAMARLVERRSLQQIEKMEKERGLRV